MSIRVTIEEKIMPALQFDLDAMARWYACAHLKTDPGIQSVHYLPHHAGDRNIRLVEVNHLLAEQLDSSMEPIDFGIDTGTDSEHRLLVLDVTPSQWQRIKSGALRLPHEWSLENAVHFQIPAGVSIEQFADQDDE